MSEKGLPGVMTPASLGVMTTSAWFCSGCGKHTALVATDRPGVVVAVEYARDGYTPTTKRHICEVREANPTATEAEIQQIVRAA